MILALIFLVSCFVLLRRPSQQLPIFEDYLEDKTLPYFPVMSKTALLKWCRKLGIFYKRHIKKCNMRRKYKAMLSALYNFYFLIKMETKKMLKISAS